MGEIIIAKLIVIDMRNEVFTLGCISMGSHANKSKQFRRELKQYRTKNQRTNKSYFTEQYRVFQVAVEEPMLEDQNAELKQSNEEVEEINEILKRSMLVLPYFSSKIFEQWTIKMERLLGSVDLW